MNDRRTLLTTIPALTTLGLLPDLGEATATPTDPLSIIAAYADAWLRGDHAAALACYHEDFTLHYHGNNALSGDHAGKPRAIATLRELARRTGWQVMEIKKMLAGADCAALVARMRYRRDGTSVERDRVLIFAVAAGRLRECWAYDEDQALMDQLIGAQ
jgi:uncharacterized protein